MRSLAPACCAAACALLLSACGARPARVLYLVPIHAAPELIESLAAYYRDRLGVNVQLPGAVQVDSLAFDTSRRQLVAEEAIKLLRPLRLARRGRPGNRRHLVGHVHSRLAVAVRLCVWSAAVQ